MDWWHINANIYKLGEGIYNSSVVVYKLNFIQPDHPQTKAENVENMQMRVKLKFTVQAYFAVESESGTNGTETSVEV